MSTRGGLCSAHHGRLYKSNALLHQLVVAVSLGLFPLLTQTHLQELFSEMEDITESVYSDFFSVIKFN